MVFGIWGDRCTGTSSVESELELHALVLFCGGMHRSMTGNVGSGGWLCLVSPDAKRERIVSKWRLLPVLVSFVWVDSMRLMVSWLVGESVVNVQSYNSVGFMGDGYLDRWRLGGKVAWSRWFREYWSIFVVC